MREQLLALNAELARSRPSMASAELDAPDWPGVTVRNVLYFDLTPGRLVSAWIDETGVRWPETGP